MNIKTVILLICTTALVSACASNKRQGQPRRHMDPVRMERVYIQFVERWDFNEDGVATCDDIGVQRSRLFNQLDGDKNGELTRSEYRYAKFEDKSFLFFPIDRVDTNASATVNVDEFVAVFHSEFLNIDQDHDCQISQREAVVAMRAIQGGETGDKKRKKGGKHGKGKGGGAGFPGTQYIVPTTAED